MAPSSTSSTATIRSPEDASVVVGETDYGVTFAAVVATGNVVATQFHPEKSGEAGLRLYENFLRLAREGRCPRHGQSELKRLQLRPDL